MRNIIEDLLASGKPLGLGSGGGRFYVDNRRLQRNLERVIADPAMTAAARTGVVTDPRVAETLMKADALARSIILQTEAKLGRTLGRERAQKLVARYIRIRVTRTQPIPVVHPHTQVHQRLAA